MLFIINLIFTFSLLLYINIMLSHLITNIGKKDYGKEYNAKADAKLRLILIIIISLSWSLRYLI